MGIDPVNYEEMHLPVNYEEIHWSERKLVREEYIRRQKGLCFYCGNSLEGDPSDSVKDIVVTKKLFPKCFFKYPVHLHHNRKTKMTIGAVHSHCNAVLWEHHGE